ncbi:MAG TPA: hypothetical protein VE569_09320, partial [Acidimicrobiia bacterium]|nr:hypothetical protein [Acidimicrobiia bacterium]
MKVSEAEALTGHWVDPAVGAKLFGAYSEAWIQEILGQADELAKKFEDYEPGEGDQVPVEEYLLRRAVLARARSEREVVHAVGVARSSG